MGTNQCSYLASKIVGIAFVRIHVRYGGMPVSRCAASVAMARELASTPPTTSPAFTRIQPIHSRRLIQTNWIKGTVSRDFLYSVFSPKQLLLVPLDMPWGRFDFFAYWLRYGHFKMTPRCPMNWGVFFCCFFNIQAHVAAFKATIIQKTVQF